jgi:hypothetical protein
MLGYLLLHNVELVPRKTGERCSEKTTGSPGNIGKPYQCRVCEAFMRIMKAPITYRSDVNASRK